MGVGERVSDLGPETFSQKMTLMSHSHLPTSQRVAVREAVVEEAYQVPSHLLAMDHVIDWKVLKSLHYSQPRLQRQLVAMQAVLTALQIDLQMDQPHCLEMLATEEAAQMSSTPFEIASWREQHCKESLGMNLIDSVNWIWILDCLGEAVEGVTTAGATLHRCRIS